MIGEHAYGPGRSLAILLLYMVAEDILYEFCIWGAVSLTYEESLRYDGFVKSPSAALRFIFRHCSVRLCTPQTSRFARLVPPVAGELFTVPSTLATFHEVIRYGLAEFRLCAILVIRGTSFRPRR